MENREKCYHCGSEKLVKERLDGCLTKIAKDGGYLRYPLHSMICLDCGTVVRLFIELK